MTIEPQAIWAALGGTITAIISAALFIWRSNTLARNYADKQRSDGELIREKSTSNVMEKLVEIAAQGLVVQKDMVEVARETAKSQDRNAAEMRGMVTMQSNHTQMLRDTAVTVDDMSAQVTGISKVTTTLQTDIEGSLTGQIGPVVIAIQGIGKQLDTLNITLQTKDEATIKLMGQLQFSFGALETTLLKMLEPIALRTLNDIQTVHTENGDIKHDA